VSRIDELIAERCPKGVEFKTLCEVLRIKNGKDHKALGDGDIPVYGSGGVMRYADTAAAEGPSVLIPRKGSLGNLFYVEGPFWVVDTIFRTEINLSLVEPKFLYHQLLTMGLGGMNQAGGVPSQTQSVLNLLRIPVPPLEIQREIVRILDKFTELEAELETELEARTTQYEETRNSLLSLDGDLTGHPLAELIAERCPNGVEFKTLGDVASVGTGSSDRKDASDGGEFPFYVRSKNVLRIDSYEFDEDAILIPGEGGIGEIFHFVSGKYALHQRAYRISFKTPDIDTKFAYYVFSVHFRKFILQKAVSATVTSIRKPMITDFQIPVPPLEIQREIVRILDKFDALVNDLSVGLPAEIAARRKQYEYYRDRLLSFEELAG